MYIYIETTRMTLVQVIPKEYF